MQYHLSQISAISYIPKLGIVALAGENIRIINLSKEKEQQEIKTQRFLMIFQLIFNEQDNNLYQFNVNKTIIKYKMKGRNFMLDNQIQLEYDFYPTLATVTNDNQIIILSGMDTNQIVFYNMINQCLTKIELPDFEFQNYCLLYNRQKNCLLTQACRINVRNQKIIHQIKTQFSRIKGQSYCGHFYTRQDNQKAFITSAFKQKILRTLNNNFATQIIYSQTGKYLCFQNLQDKIQLYDITTGTSHYIFETKSLSCQNFQFHQNDQILSYISNGKSAYIWNLSQIINKQCNP